VATRQLACADTKTGSAAGRLRSAALVMLVGTGIVVIVYLVSAEF
jgi:hypothetical protein